MEIWKFLIILFVIIFLVTIGNKVVYKNDYAVITGSAKIPAESQQNIKINYPSEFNASNCVPITCGIKCFEQNGYEYVGEYRDALSLYWNGFTKYVNFLDNNINLNLSNPTENERTFSYKIVLMKI